MSKVGIGYDVHAFAEDRKLFLGGVEIPHTKGLSGHSDADVLLHAVCDAMLGALGKGDIGELFPDTDARYKDISSVKLLQQVYALVEQEGFCIGNVDTVVIAQEPKLKDFKEKIRASIAEALGVSASLINIKATTTEGLGFTGRSEGIAAQAVVLIEK
ncbi:MAG: 2-C-methyl-D-erythritol 2,4-cyclodiphosphate synthase [Candidatus Omnitrophica bacterium]|nr:2-C-methyl-D-erythritol 2,4-cyclodiphosphate synthase [Candidatus Omnitrophota bacterium]